MQATWLQGHPFRATLDLHQARNFEDFRKAFSGWAMLPLSFVYADRNDQIGWQLVGRPPRRKKGNGMIPMPGWDLDAGWEKELEPFERMPFLKNPPSGFVASANNRPISQEDTSFLGEDWLGPYRFSRIVEKLKEKDDWDPASCLEFQLDEKCLAWDETRDILLPILEGEPHLRNFHQLLTDWNGVVAKDSAATSVFELFIHEMILRTLKAKAPKTWQWAQGVGFCGELLPYTMWGFSRRAWIVRLLREGLDRSEIIAAFNAVDSLLKKRCGKNPASWKWGWIRPLELRHSFGKARLLRPIFNLGPFPWGGDSDTVSQASIDPLNPFASPPAIANLRMVVDVGAWENSRFVLAGGQSGNPCSPHYSDLLPLWKKGQGVPIAWSDAELKRSLKSELSLVREEDTR
jgi:penicillin amidase